MSTTTNATIGAYPASRKPWPVHLCGVTRAGRMPAGGTTQYSPPCIAALALNQLLPIPRQRIAAALGGGGGGGRPCCPTGWQAGAAGGGRLPPKAETAWCWQRSLVILAKWFITILPVRGSYICSKIFTGTRGFAAQHALSKGEGGQDIVT